MSAPLIACLRWHRWSPEEAATLVKRRTHAKLCRHHLDAACDLYSRDGAACRWHVERMVALRPRGMA
jgi:hypothetical protein